jgi:hypothetical protein
VAVIARSKVRTEAAWEVLEAMAAAKQPVCVAAVNVVLTAFARIQDMEAVRAPTLTLTQAKAGCCTPEAEWEGERVP